MLEGSNPAKLIGDEIVVDELGVVSEAEAASRAGCSASLWAPSWRKTASTVSAPAALYEVFFHRVAVAIHLVLRFVVKVELSKLEFSAAQVDGVG